MPNNPQNSRLAALAASRQANARAQAPAPTTTRQAPAPVRQAARPVTQPPVLVTRQQLPKAPVRPAAPNPRRVAPNPNRIDRSVKPLNDRAIAGLGQRNARINPEDLNQASLSGDQFVDTTHLDPGPPASDVPFGYNCGSCSKFLALNDARRDDPEFMETYLASAQHCPLAVIQVMRIKGDKTPDELVRRANNSACGKFKIDNKRATPEFIELLAAVRGTTRGEFDVITSQLDTIHREKTLEDRYGYRLGEIIKTRLAGVEGPVSARVVGFKGKNVVIQAKVDGRIVTAKLPIVEARPTE